MLTPHSNLEKLSQGDLVATLNHLGITCTLADAELMIRRYDGDFDGKLSFWEFQNIFMPVCPIARQKVDQRNRQAPQLTCETRALTIGMLSRAVDAERMIEQIRLNARRDNLSNLREIFDEFDWLNRGYLTTNEIRRHF